MDAGRRGGVDGISIGHRSCGNTHSASDTYGGYAVAIGFESAYDGNGAKAIAIGYKAGRPTTGSHPPGPNCICIGTEVQVGTDNDIVMGYKAGGLRNGTSSTKNIIMGYECQAGDATDSSHHMIRNIIMGERAAYQNHKGGYDNILLGYKAGQFTLNSDGETGEANAGNIISIGANSAFKFRNWRINIGNTAGGKHALRGGIATVTLLVLMIKEFKQWLLIWAGQTDQGTRGLAIGHQAGMNKQINEAIWVHILV